MILKFFQFLKFTKKIRFGRKKTILAGIGTYVVTSITCGFAWNIHVLVGFRLLQAVGVASLLVIGTGVVSDIYPPEIRGNALVKKD